MPYVVREYIHTASERKYRAGIAKEPGYREKRYISQLDRMTTQGKFPGAPTNPYVWTTLSYQSLGLIPNAVVNKALLRLHGKTGSSSQLGSSIFAEGHQSLKMIADRATSLYKAFRKAKKGDLAGAANSIVGKKGSRIVKRAGALYLEGSYGWKPLFQDVHDSLRTVAQEARPEWYAVKASAKGSVDKETWHFPDRNSPSDRLYGWWRHYTANYSVQVRAKVKVVNPNAYLMSRLQLSNPASWAWEFIPGSFIADWFTNVNEIIASLDMWAGIEFSDTGMTRYIEGNEEFTYGNGELFRDCIKKKGVGYTRHIVRTTGLPSITWEKPQLFPIHEWRRALNACSLLAQVLR